MRRSKLRAGDPSLAGVWGALCLGLILSSLACREPTLRVRVEPPPETAWIAALWLGGDGAFLGATGLERWRPGTALRGTFETASTDTARVGVVAFTEGRLAGLVLPADEALAARALRPAHATDALLPTPSWTGTAELVDGRAEVSPGPVPLELTAPWLPACPTLIPPGLAGSVDVDCLRNHCGARITQSECTLDANLAGCGIEATAIALDGRGQSRSPGCAMAAPLSGATAAIRCGECTTEVYVPPFPDRFVVDELAVLDVPALTSGPIVPPATGYLAGAARAGPLAAVVSYGGARVDVPCTATASSTIHLLDLDARREVGRTGAPPCLGALAGDPSSDGFFGITSTPPYHLFRFDGRARVAASAAIDSVSPADHTIGPLAVSSDGAHVVVGFSRRRVGVVAKLLVFEPRTLALERVISSGQAADPDGEIYSLLGLAGSVVAAGTDPAALVRYYDVASGLEAAAVRVGVGFRVNKAPFYLSSVDRVVVASAPDEGHGAVRVPLIHFLSTTSNVPVMASSWQLAASPTATHAWPDGQDLVLATLVASTPEHEAWVALASTSEARVLPGATRVGTGPASAILEAPSGELWLVLPWTAHLARVRPR